MSSHRQRQRFFNFALQLCILHLAFLIAQPAPARSAEIWQETKINGRSCVTFASFCEFYEFNQIPVPERDAFTISSVYGSLTLKANSREAFFNGRQLWLSFPFIRDDQGNAYVPRLDVIKLFDPLLRRNEIAPRKKVLGVVIDPGHGGADHGTRSRANYYEKTAALDTARRLQAILQARKIPTFMTRAEDVFITLEERCALANRHRDWIFVSLHYNEARPGAHGVETYCLTPQYAASTADGGSPRSGDREQQPGNQHDALNILLADYVQAEMTKLHSSQGDRGIKRARFVVLRDTEIPAILVEGGFLSSPVDAGLITTGAYRQKLAEAIARGVGNYLDLMTSPVGKAPTVLKPVDRPKFRAPTASTLKPVAAPSAAPVPVIPNLREITRPVPAPAPVAPEQPPSADSEPAGTVSGT